MIRLSVYADAHDLTHLDAAIATLHRVGSTRALCMVSGPNGWAVDPLRFALACTRLRAQSIEPMAVAFPPVNGDHDAAIAHYRVCRASADGGQLDAEPKQIGRDAAGKPIMAHWTPPLIKRWLEADPTMSITTTRVEAPHLGAHGRVTYGQMEQQTSFATVDAAIAIFTRYAPASNLHLVSGAFSKPDDPRTLAEFRADLHAARPQAEFSGEHAIWSCHTLRPEFADALREWAT